MLKEYKIRGIDCANCARKVEDKLNKEDYVKKISIDILTDTLIIDSKNQQRVIGQIKDMEPSAVIKDVADDSEEECSKEILYQIVIGLGLIIISQFFKDNIQIVILLISYILVGYKVLLRSFKNILKGNMFDEFFLMSIATLAAILIGDVFEAVMVMLLYMIGEYLQARATNKSKKSIQDILEFQVKDVEKVIDGKNILVSPYDLLVGDEIKVKVGEKIPVDSILLDEKIQFNTSTLTGESVPRGFYKGDEVLAGIIAEERTANLRVNRTYDNSTISKMIKLIKESNKNKSKTEKFITKFARVYTPIVVLLALCLVVFLPLIGVPFDEAVYRAIILLVISCPCALVISVPLGYFMSIGKNTKDGVLIKGASFIDVLAKLEVLVVDKTGTLTKGNFKVDKVINYSARDEKELLKIVTLGERSSSHPIAKSICSYYNENYKEEIVGINVEEIKGKGIKYKYNEADIFIGNRKLLEDNQIDIKESNDSGTLVYVAIGNEHVMTIAIRDQIKEDTIEVLSLLKEHKVKDVIMLTGDTYEVANEVALEVGITKFYSGLLPEQKVEKLREIKKEYNYVGFVGDGINDAASLALADVGIAMGGIGSDVAIQSADVIVNNDSLMNLYKAINTSRRGLSIIKVNILFSIGIKVLFITLALFGQANMIEAIFADVGVTLLAILNTLRILK